MSDKTVFNNPVSGETLVHLTRPDGTRDLFTSQTGSQTHGHAVIGQNGNVRNLRDTDGHTIAHHHR